MKDDTVYLRHILDAIRRIEQYLGDVSYDHFMQNSLLQDGVIRQITIIGEAARSVSDVFRNAHPELPWSEMVGMRNKLIHDYFEVDFSTVWDTAKSDLPRLKQQVEQSLEAHRAQTGIPRGG